MAKQKILFAEDDSDDQMFFEQALKDVSARAELAIAGDGEALMDMLRGASPLSPDIIFLDLNLPRKNGFECLKEIKAARELQGIPIIIFSTSAKPGEIDRAYAQGADLYVQKPFSYQLLKKTILGILSIEWGAGYTRPGKESFLLSFR